jgi:hypothetical protein
MRTPKELYPSERIIYKPEVSACPHCRGPLVMYNYLASECVKHCETTQAGN